MKCLLRETSRIHRFFSAFVAVCAQSLKHWACLAKVFFISLKISLQKCGFDADELL